MMSNKVGKWKSISRFISAPYKFLIRARNLYVKGFSDCSTNVSVSLNYGLVGNPPKFSEFPPSNLLQSSSSLSTNGTDHDLISSATVGRKSDLEILRSEKPRSKLQSHLAIRRREVSRSSVVRRSRLISTVAAFGRIDENEPYDVSGEEDIKLMGDHVFSSCRSHAMITNRRASRRY